MPAVGRRLGWGTEVLPFKGFDVFGPIGDTSSEAEMGWPFLQPAPSLQRARAEIPAAREFDLVQVLDGHVQFSEG
jgi:hypothetical protein